MAVNLSTISLSSSSAKISDDDASLLNKLSSVSKGISSGVQKIGNLASQVTKQKNDIALSISSRIKDAGGDVNALNIINESVLSSNKYKIDSSVLKEMKNSASNLQQLANDGSTAVASAVSSATKKLSSLSDSVSSDVNASLTGSISDLNDSMSSFSDLYNTAGQVMTNVDLLSQDKTSPSTPDSSGGSGSNVTDASLYQQDMAYEPNGMKHFMNSFTSLLTKKGIKYTVKSARRYALDPSDNIVQGDAFVRKTGSLLYKTKDSDGQIYWFSNKSSRHYYGEAVDVIPSSGTFAELLSSLCLTNEVTDFMHSYGLCLEVETSDSGASTGEHFNISTQGDTPQLLWWKVVNQMRSDASLSTYTSNLGSNYFEPEITNKVVEI